MVFSAPEQEIVIGSSMVGRWQKKDDRSGGELVQSGQHRSGGLYFYMVWSGSTTQKRSEMVQTENTQQK